MSKKKIRIITIIVVGTIVLLVGWLMLCGYLWSWGPFATFHNAQTAKLPGNSAEYNVENVQQLSNNALTGKNILYLGSSVTYGASSCQTSFVEYIANRNNTTYVKAAESGTTLVDEGINSYVSRLQQIDKTQQFDLFICQLSTNDASQNKALGAVSTNGNYNTKTVCGAIQFIVDYVDKTWHCPVVFYTNCYYESDAYAAMVAALKQVASHANIFIIDLYSDADFNTLTAEQRKLYLADKIHPTKAGYLLWWTPKMEEYLIKILQEQ